MVGSQAGDRRIQHNVKIVCGSFAAIALLVAACADSDDDARRSTRIPDGAQIQFTPAYVRIGGAISVTGAGWSPGELNLFLVARDETESDDFADRYRGGDLRSLGKVEVSADGTFELDIVIPSTLPEADGDRREVASGEYSIGGGVPQGLRASGVLTVLP